MTLRAAISLPALGLFLLAAAPLAARAEDPVTEQARETYGFATWPGRDGPARDGIDLARLGTLAGPDHEALRCEFRALPGGPVATVAAEDGSLLVHVFVEDDPLAAQEALLHYLAGCARRLERLEDERARGDVAFGAQSGEGEILVFARANLAAVVRGPKELVSAAAGRLEALIEKSPLLDGARKRTVAEVERFEAAEALGGHRTRLRIEVRGEVARRELRAEGAFVEDGGSGATVIGARDAGFFAVTVHLLSPRGWRTGATARIRVD